MGRLRVTLVRPSPELKGSGKRSAGLTWAGKWWEVDDSQEARAWCEANSVRLWSKAGDSRGLSGSGKTGDRSANGPDGPTAPGPGEPFHWCYEAFGAWHAIDPTGSFADWDRYACARVAAVAMRAWGLPLPVCAWDAAVQDRRACLKVVELMGLTPGMSLGMVEHVVQGVERGLRESHVQGRGPLLTWRLDAAAALGLMWAAESRELSREDALVKLKALHGGMGRFIDKAPARDWAELVLLRWTLQQGGVQDKYDRAHVSWSSVRTAEDAILHGGGQLPEWWTRFKLESGHPPAPHGEGA